MEPIEIIVIVAASAIVLSVLGTYIYKKVKHLPTGECASCATKGNKLLKEYNKKYKKKSANKDSKI